MPRFSDRTEKFADEKFIRDQGDLIRKLADGYRRCFQELNKDMPDIDRAKDILDEYYIGGRGQLLKAMKGPVKLR